MHHVLGGKEAEAGDVGLQAPLVRRDPGAAWAGWV